MKSFNHLRLLPDRRRFLKVASVISAAAWMGWLSGCSKSGPIRIASSVWLGYEFLFLARDMGWLKPEDAILVETPNASDSIKRLLNGEVQGAALTLDETLRAVQQGLSLWVVLLFNVSSGADVLMVKPHIKTLADLKGARIAVETTAVGALMLKKILAKAGLTAAEIEVIHIDTEDHLASWQNNHLDALITYEPYANKIEQLGTVRLFDSREMPNTIFDVLAVKRDAAEDYKQQLLALIGCHFKAQRAWKTNPVDTSYRLAKLLNSNAADIPVLYRGLDLPDLVYNRHFLGGETSQLNQLAEEISVLCDINPDLIPADLFNAAYLPES